MRNDVIEVRGARENNLAGVDLDVPKWTLVVFTGVSGSGKSSLVFGTIAAESQRLINETYTAFLQSLMPALPRPDVARISGLNAVIVVDQERMGANSRSTVGTATDTWTMLRVLFARAGSPAVPGPSALSFNDPTGMCPACEGIGTVATMNVDAVLDRSLSLNAGAITFPNFAVGSLFWQIFADSGYFDLDTPIAKWSQAELDQLLTGTGGKVGTGSYKLSYEGLLDKIKRLYLSKDRDALQPHIRKALDGAAAVAVCSGCEGTRLNDAARACILGGRSIAGCNGMQVDDLAAWARTLNDPRIAPLVGGLVSTLDNLVEIGLGYLSLDRPTGTLSGGEAQRVKMVRHLDSSLNEMTYVFDEPTGGLHAHDTERTIGLLRRLRDKGNTVLVVEHDPDVIAAADHVVDLGPGAGTAGGHVVYQGDVEGLRRSGSLTGHHLDVRQPHPCPAANPDRSPVHRGCDGQQPAWGQRRRPARCADGRDRGRRIGQELADPRCATTPGRPGGGRPVPNQGVPTLQPRHLLRGPRRASGTPSPRQTPSRPRCSAPTPMGHARPATALASSTPISPTCPASPAHARPAMAAGSPMRYSSIGCAARDISQVLSMTIDEAAAFFTEKSVRPVLSSLTDAGIGYLRLGQPMTTLSGGERQRLRLGIEMARGAGTFVLDEPSSGLHLADVDHLIVILDRIVDGGGTAIVIEHNLDIVARADWVIDLGPGAGHDGGRVIYQGPPAGLPIENSLTGRHLRRSREAVSSNSNNGKDRHL